LASKNDFEVAGHVFEAAPESLRPPRIVRVGLIQNKIVLPTTADIKDQRDAILAKIGTIIQAAAQAKVNIVCLQEAFSEFEI
jgi:beta-ureidopropionase